LSALLGVVAIASACQQPVAPSAPPTNAAPPTSAAPPVAAGPKWPNEPAGMRVVADWGLDEVPPATARDVAIPGSPGWKVAAGAEVNSPRGWLQLASDPAAPISAPHVYDFVYPQGMVEGNAPATVYFGGLRTRAIYVAFWWKTSVPFDRGPSGNKIAFMFNGNGQLFMTLLPDGRLHVLPEYPGDFKWRDPLPNAAAVTLGAWHLVEWFADLSDGTLQWWLDGALNGSHRDLSNRSDFDEFQFSPTWGGNTGNRKRQTDHYWFDHVHLSVQ